MPRSGFGIERERLFQKGNFKYLILDLLAEKSCYGYEIIRALEERFHGFYIPSPGIVYPTLQMLEEMGYVTSSQQENKRVYTITPEGRRYLAEGKHIIDAVKSEIENWWNPEMHNSLHQIMHEMAGLSRFIASQARRVSPEQLDQVHEILSRTSKEIEGILKKTEKPNI